MDKVRSSEMEQLGNSLHFTVMSAVRQGCILSPLLFVLAIDWVVKALTGLDGNLECIDCNRLCDLDYADDIALIDTSHCRMHMMTETWRMKPERLGYVEMLESVKQWLQMTGKTKKKLRLEIQQLKWLKISVIWAVM